MSDVVNVETVHQIIKNLELNEEKLTKEEEKKSNVQENMKELNVNDEEIHDNDSENDKIKQQIEENHHGEKGVDNLERDSNEEQKEIADMKPLEEQSSSGQVHGLNDDVEETEQSMNIQDDENEMHFNEAEDELVEEEDANKLNGMEEDQEVEADKVSNEETIEENADYYCEDKEKCDKMCQVDETLAHYLDDGLEEELLKEIEELQEKLALQDFNNAAQCADAAKHRGGVRQAMLNDLQSLLTCLGPSLTDEERHLAEELMELHSRGDQIAIEFEVQYQAHLQQRIQLEEMIQQELHLRNILEEILAFLDSIENEAIGEEVGEEDNGNDDDDEDVFYEPPRKNCRNGS